VNDPLVGRRFGSYVVELKLGEGGMGAVYRAIQPEIGKQVAIKFLAPALSANPNVVQRFFAEARAVNLIQHDNIVDIFDFGQIDGHSYFVMELLRGSSLEGALEKEGKLSIGRTLDVAMQVADAIAAAHAHQIVHRDLKPDNIFLVTRSGRTDFVKLLDFGIAKLTDASGQGIHRTAFGAVLGTPGYMSPEQGTGGGVDLRTDIYALGVILFRMLSGRLPFDGRTFPEILQKQITEPPPDLRSLRPEVSMGLSQLIHQMFAREAEHRPGTMLEVLERMRGEIPAGYARPNTGPVPLLRTDQSGAHPLVSATGKPPTQPPAQSIPPRHVSASGSTTLSGAAGQQALAPPDSIGDQPRRSRGAIFALAGAALVAIAVPSLYFALRKPNGPPAPPPTIVNHASPVANAARPTPPQPAPAPAPAPHPAPSAPGSDDTFAVLIESDPPGANIMQGTKSLGTTPLKVSLSGSEASLRLKLDGYRDGRIEVSRGIDHVFERMRKATRPEVTAPPAPPPPVKPPTGPIKAKKPRIGLDD
jgi:eukaryotic-like serine/threonine-protein kinase